MLCFSSPVGEAEAGETLHWGPNAFDIDAKIERKMKSPSELSSEGLRREVFSLFREA